MRKEFGQVLYELVFRDDKIVLLLGDIGYGIFDNIKSSFPNKIINVGICEQTIVGMAAGMALEGYKPYIYSITPFILERPFEQIKLDIDSQNLNVKIVGYAYYPTLGPSHTIASDEIFKHFVNIKSYFPKSSQETREAVMDSYFKECPAIISLGKE